MKTIHLALWAAAAVPLSMSAAASAADAERGRMLYELRCGECHAESVHGRAQRDARTFADVLAYVVRWSAQLNMDWRSDDINDVAKYVNDTYYGFKCQGPAC